ncbi:MAG: DNA mismatch endonuclease Vsr [Candidatus Latescibacteria bacterium]|nr:DNA mismatch endonuclease Vsr [Candidatus Latescibacterota bacterium]
MPDRMTKAQRSYCMSQVKGKDTSLERRVRAALHRRGWRFRKHIQSLPGRPDVVFPARKVAVFLDGDFWHGYRFPLWSQRLPPFWQAKIARNRQRDRRNFRRLRAMGWKVVRIWEHEVQRDLGGCLARIEKAVTGGHIPH